MGRRGRESNDKLNLTIHSETGQDYYWEKLVVQMDIVILKLLIQVDL